MHIPRTVFSRACRTDEVQQQLRSPLQERCAGAAKKAAELGFDIAHLAFAYCLAEVSCSGDGGAGRRPHLAFAYCLAEVRGRGPAGSCAVMVSRGLSLGEAAHDPALPMPHACVCERVPLPLAPLPPLHRFVLYALAF